ncbi:carbohydrate esterase family 8 protein [Collybiopsis luxurians FD-317 M1]|uniref:Pectinesterase n=1 Tax=Collybiopsis luxurians FD-317 M1 TaxID=944289 RepID=A0A0D0BFF9_9AGAR|nr:carbohydrate esterase family 8 protein [Collybiopsis luxurians FD-317 M1]
MLLRLSSLYVLCTFVFLHASAIPIGGKFGLQKRTSRLTPPAGAIVVSKTPASGQFSTVQAAVNSLPDDDSEQTIFINAGTYSEQVSITRTGMLTIMGATSDTSTQTSNQVTITHSASLGTAGSDDLSGTLRVHKDNFALYNVNVKNTFGESADNGQAIALSAYGTNHGYYASGFYSYQDTVLAEQGNQYYGFCYIEGAVDFIFGQHARAFFQKNTIASVGPGTITADGPDSKTDGLFVINESTIEQSAAATTSLTEQVYLGRPWTEFATVAFTSCSLSSIINPAGWEIWSTAMPNTGDVTFAEYENTGPGAAGTRASFATQLTSNAAYNVGVVLGADWATWVDQSYV